MVIEAYHRVGRARPPGFSGSDCLKHGVVAAAFGDEQRRGGFGLGQLVHECRRE
jgi:hypothetical protein